MTWSDLTQLACFLLIGGSATYLFAEPIARFYSGWSPDAWDGQPDCQRTTGRIMGGFGAALLVAVALRGLVGGV
jgi:hypothetical protein